MPLASQRGAQQAGIKGCPNKGDTLTSTNMHTIRIMSLII